MSLKRPSTTAGAVKPGAGCWMRAVDIVKVVEKAGDEGDESRDRRVEDGGRLGLAACSNKYHLEIRMSRDHTR